MRIREFHLSSVSPCPEPFKLEVNNRYLVAGVGIILTAGALIYGTYKFYSNAAVAPAQQTEAQQTETHAQLIKSDLSERLK